MVARYESLMAIHLVGICLFEVNMLPVSMQGAEIDQNTFNYAYDEYRLADMAKQIQCKYVNSLECLACGDAPHAVHMDGNHKLFVWDRQQGHTRRATTAEILYSQDAAVMRHLDYLDLALGPNQQVKLCLLHVA